MNHPHATSAWQAKSCIVLSSRNGSRRRRRSIPSSLAMTIFAFTAAPTCWPPMRRPRPSWPGVEVLGPEDVGVEPTIAAAAVSGGPAAAADFERLLVELLEAGGHREEDGLYLCLHCGMAGEAEDDPEGRGRRDFAACSPTGRSSPRSTGTRAHRPHVGRGRRARAVSHLPARRSLRDRQRPPAC